MSGQRLVLLDNEAVQALLDPRHRRHRAAVAAVQASVARNLRERSFRLAVPTAVRVESGWDRRSADVAGINRLRVDDAPLDGPVADRAAAIRRALAVSVADAHLGAVLPAGEPVAVLTSDVEDVRRMADHLGVAVNVVAL